MYKLHLNLCICTCIQTTIIFHRVVSETCLLFNPKNRWNTAYVWVHVLNFSVTVIVSATFSNQLFPDWLWAKEHMWVFRPTNLLMKKTLYSGFNNFFQYVLFLCFICEKKSRGDYYAHKVQFLSGPHRLFSYSHSTLLEFLYMTF